MRWITLPGLLLSVTALWAEPASEDYRFDQGDITLSGTLVLPHGPGPHPATVFVHGSGPHTRDGPLSYADTFTDAGVALLAFDKRGTGQSTGSWTSASLFDLAEDIAAAVASLRADPRIDPERIGLWGVSQGGWIAPLVIAEDPRMAFLMVTSGGGASPLQSELFSYQQACDHAAIPAESQAEAYSVLGQYFRYLGQGRGREELMATLDRVQDRDWYPHAALKRITPSESGRKHWSWVANWDPLLSIAAVHCPVLLVFGDQDRQQPTELALVRWRQGLALAGNPDLTVRVFENANHGIRQVGGDAGHAGGHGRAPLVPGYRDLMRDWLKDKAR